METIKIISACIFFVLYCYGTVFIIRKMIGDRREVLDDYDKLIKERKELLNG